MLQTEFRAESLALAQRIVEHAGRAACTPMQFALAWVWNNALVHGVIGGPKTLAQWQEYVDAIGTPFDAADEALVDSLVAPGHASTPGYTDPVYPVTGRQPRNRLRRSGRCGGSGAGEAGRLEAAERGDCPELARSRVSRRRGTAPDRRRRRRSRSPAAVRSCAVASQSPHGARRRADLADSKSRRGERRSVHALARVDRTAPALTAIARSRPDASRYTDRPRSARTSRSGIVSFHGARDAEEGDEHPEEVGRRRPARAIDDPVGRTPARDATAARETREGEPVQDERIERQQHDQHQLGLQLRIGEVVGAIERAQERRWRRPVSVEDGERDDDDAGDEFVRRRDPHAVLRELRQEPQVGRDDGAERDRGGEQVRRRRAARWSIRSAPYAIEHRRRRCRQKL